MGSVIRFDEHDLIFVVEIQWSLLIYLDGEMEHGSSYFGCVTKAELLPFTEL